MQNISAVKEAMSTAPFEQAHAALEKRCFARAVFPRIATISPGDAQKLMSDSTVCLPSYEKQPFSTVRVTAATPLFFA